MTTAFRTGPGFCAVETSKVDRTLPPGVMRIYCARLEAYDLPANDDVGANASFTILASLAEKDPNVAKALLHICEHVNQNRALIEQSAKRQ